jgi:hypothetical protein
VSERLPKLKENSKLIKLKKERNGIIEEILKEDQSDIKDINKFQSDIKDINKLMYAAAKTTRRSGKKRYITCRPMKIFMLIITALPSTLFLYL